MPFIVLLIFLWLAISGLVRLVAPAWQLNVDKKHAKSAEQAVPDSKRLTRIRISGGVRLAAVAGLIWATGMAITRSPAPEVPAGANELERILYERGAEFVKRGKTAGLTIAAVSGDQEAVIEVGFSKLGSRAPVTAETLFEIGSITKVFTGIALARHVEAGELKLDDTISNFLPKGFEVADAAKNVTLGQLTTHSSGFPRMPGRPRVWDIVNFIVFGGDPYVGITLDRFGDAMRNVKLNAKPGEKMEYSNFGVSLLGWLLAQRSGTTYEQYIRARVLEPLGMAATFLNGTAANQAHFSKGYRSVVRFGPITLAWRSSPWSLTDHLAGAGGLCSTGRDMLKFLRANMHPENTAIAAALKRSHRELFRDNDRRGVGMNWIRSQKSKDSPVVIWHNGGTGGFRSYLGFLEDGSAGVVVLSNSAADVDPLGAELLKAIAEDKTARK